MATHPFRSAIDRTQLRNQQYMTASAPRIDVVPAEPPHTGTRFRNRMAPPVPCAGRFARRTKHAAGKPADALSELEVANHQAGIAHGVRTRWRPLRADPEGIPHRQRPIIGSADAGLRPGRPWTQHDTQPQKPSENTYIFHNQYIITKKTPLSSCKYTNYFRNMQKKF